VPDDRNMLNEQLWSPDRPKFRGKKLKGTGVFLKFEIDSLRAIELEILQLVKIISSVKAKNSFVSNAYEYDQLAREYVV